MCPLCVVPSLDSCLSHNSWQQPSPCLSTSDEGRSLPEGHAADGDTSFFFLKEREKNLKTTMYAQGGGPEKTGCGQRDGGASNCSRRNSGNPDACPGCVWGHDWGRSAARDTSATQSISRKANARPGHQAARRSDLRFTSTDGTGRPCNLSAIKKAGFRQVCLSRRIRPPRGHVGCQR